MKPVPTPGRTRDGMRQGLIVPIGGAEEKLRDRRIIGYRAIRYPSVISRSPATAARRYDRSLRVVAPS